MRNFFGSLQFSLYANSSFADPRKCQKCVCLKSPFLFHAALYHLQKCKTSCKQGREGKRHDINLDLFFVIKTFC